MDHYEGVGFTIASSCARFPHDVVMLSKSMIIGLANRKGRRKTVTFQYQDGLLHTGTSKTYFDKALIILERTKVFT